MKYRVVKEGRFYYLLIEADGMPARKDRLDEQQHRALLETAGTTWADRIREDVGTSSGPGEVT